MPHRRTSAAVRHVAPFAAEMLVYRVTWKNGDVSILGIGPDDDLVDAVDQIGDASDAKVEIFAGPMLVTLPLGGGVRLEACDVTRRMIEASRAD